MHVNRIAVNILGIIKGFRPTGIQALPSSRYLQSYFIFTIMYCTNISIYMSLKTVLHPSFSPSNNKSAGIKFYKSMTSCYSSVNQMAAGSRLQVQSWIFSSFTYFSNILYAVKLRILGLKVQALRIPSARYFNHIIITTSIYLLAATEWLAESEPCNVHEDLRNSV